MKKTLLISFLPLLIGCDFKENEYEKRFSLDLNDIKKPAIVIAVKRDDPDAGFHGGFGSITIQGADGKYIVFDGNSFNGQSLVATLNVGDTIK